MESVSGHPRRDLGDLERSGTRGHEIFAIWDDQGRLELRSEQSGAIWDDCLVQISSTRFHACQGSQSRPSSAQRRTSRTTSKVRHRPIGLWRVSELRIGRNRCCQVVCSSHSQGQLVRLYGKRRSCEFFLYTGTVFFFVLKS